MKNVILAAMAVLTLAGPASATSDWDYFWGTTLNPANTGWNDFWYQCQDPNKTAADCAGTVFAGIGAVATLGAISIVGAIGAVGVAAALPSIGSSAAVIGMAPTTVITYGPGGATTALFGTTVSFI